MTTGDKRGAVTGRVTFSPAIEQLEPGLAIDEHALNEALQQQPDFFYRVSKQLAQLTSRRDAAKQNLAVVEAEVDGKIRHEARVHEEKITEREVESRKLMHRDVEKARDDFMRLAQSVLEFTALKEAFVQRSYVLKELVALYVNNYYGDSVNTTARHDLRDRDYDDNKKLIAADQSRRAQERRR